MQQFIARVLCALHLPPAATGNGASPWSVRYVLSLVCDHVCFGLALVLTVPPPVSMEGYKYDLKLSELLAISGLMLASRLLAIRRKEESWPGALLKLAVVIVFAKFVHEMHQMW